MIFIDSGASGNYVRRCSLEWNPRYVGALEAHGGDTITVRLATGTLVTAIKVPVNFGVKFLDSDNIERCLVLDLNLRYDLILGMAWLERHEPWIDSRSKHSVPRALPLVKLWRDMNPPLLGIRSVIGASHWLTMSVCGTSECQLVDSDDVKDMSIDKARYVIVKRHVLR